MAIDYTIFYKTLRNLEKQHRYLIDHRGAGTGSLPELVQEALAESVIQRFELCFDALWKVLRRHLIEVLGTPDVPASPRPVFRMAGEAGLLSSNGERWQDYVDARVNTTHRYNEEKAVEVIERIVPGLIEDAIDLYQTMSGETWE